VAQLDLLGNVIEESKLVVSPGPPDGWYAEVDVAGDKLGLPIYGYTNPPTPPFQTPPPPDLIGVEPP